MKFKMAITMLLLVPASLYAQDIPQNAPEIDFLNLLVHSIGGMRGASTLAIVGIVIKLLLVALDLPITTKLVGSKFKDWSSGLKLTVVLGLTMVGGVVSLMAPPVGLSLGAALVHSSTLSAFVVLSNQLYKHYFEKKA